ncbi:MAG TPA: inner membrane CreD family protein, partial [Rhodothermales bacterium]|nr:inner membrane CreD family protein [Rhodothermales bacterium]
QPTQLFTDSPDDPGYDSYARSVEMTTGGGLPSAFGVRLLLPVDEYQKTSRATTYCMLFVFLTFTTFFFVEILGGRRIHPVQYLLVGFAITLFYLLLLSFSEYIPFGSAYGTAALAVLGLVTLYAKAIFGEWKLAGVVAGLLALFYGYFYVLLQLEAYALLFGSLGLLVTLAVVMYLSREVDWYGFGGGSPPSKVPAPSGPQGPASSGSA